MKPAPFADVAPTDITDALTRLMQRWASGTYTSTRPNVVRS